RIRRGQQLPGAGKIGDVGVNLAGKDRIAVEAIDLSALDLAVPIGALDEPDHQPALRAAGEVDQEVDHEGATLLIGLDDEADTVPAGKLRIEAERLQKVEGELEPVSLLGVDVE